MRTKKIFSILLAMLMAMGVFGIMGASAAELVGEEVTVQAYKGWDALPDPFPIYDESAVRATGMDKAVILWEPFQNADGNATGDGSFYKLYNTRKPGITTAQGICEWNVYKVGADGGMEINKGKYDVRTSSSYGTGAYFTVAGNEVLLYLYQGDVPYYGWVRVQLTVKVDTNDDGVVDSEKFSNAVWVELTKPDPLKEKITEAGKEMAKKDRYTEAHIKNLERRIKNASELLTQKADQELVDKHINWLNQAIAGTDTKPDGTPVGNKWKLSGVDFIDNFLGQGVIAFIWQTIDVFAKIGAVLGPLVNFFGQIGNFFGNLMPIFGLFTGLLGL